MAQNLVRLHRFVAEPPATLMVFGYFALRFEHQWLHLLPEQVGNFPLFDFYLGYVLTVEKILHGFGLNPIDKLRHFLIV